MNQFHDILLLGIIAMLVVIVALLLWHNQLIQRKLSDKDDAIIRGIRENIMLREELRQLI